MQDVNPDSPPNPAVFRCADRLVTVSEIIAAAYFRDELEPMWQRLLRAVAAEKKAAETDLEPDELTLQSVSEVFRYERDLITAEETEQWLTERGLTCDAFTDYFERRYWAEALGGEVEPARIEIFSAESELCDALTVDLFFSGEFDRLARGLSWRLAIQTASGAESDPALIAAERKRFAERWKLDGAARREWLATLGCDRPWLESMLKLEASYRQRCEALLADDAVKHELGNHRIDFTRVDAETIELESSDAAHEAFLCAREDAQPFEELAREGGYPYRLTCTMIADLPDELRQRFLCAVPGTVFEPMPRGDGFQLCRIVRKVEPSFVDDEIRSRVERHILQRHFSELAAKHIHWLIAPGPSV